MHTDILGKRNYSKITGLDGCLLTDILLEQRNGQIVEQGLSNARVANRP